MRARAHTHTHTHTRGTFTGTFKNYYREISDVLFCENRSQNNSGNKAWKDGISNQFEEEICKRASFI